VYFHRRYFKTTFHTYR